MLYYDKFILYLCHIYIISSYILFILYYVNLYYIIIALRFTRCCGARIKHHEAIIKWTDRKMTGLIWGNRRSWENVTRATEAVISIVRN